MVPTTEPHNWWRWPLVPIAAVAGALAGMAMAVFVLFLGMMLLLGFDENGWYFRYAMPAISSAIFGYLYTRISCRMAPRAKLRTGVVMVTILGLYSLLTIALAWSIPNYPIQLPVGSLAASIVAVLTLMGAVRQHRAGA